ncbi:hypothetical protein MBLNU230_g0983t1 [Neophaeotheca triangularis]
MPPNSPNLRHPSPRSSPSHLPRLHNLHTLARINQDIFLDIELKQPKRQRRAKAVETIKLILDEPLVRGAAAGRHFSPEAGVLVELMKIGSSAFEELKALVLDPLEGWERRVADDLFLEREGRLWGMGGGGVGAFTGCSGEVSGVNQTLSGLGSGGHGFRSGESESLRGHRANEMIGGGPGDGHDAYASLRPVEVSNGPGDVFGYHGFFDHAGKLGKATGGSPGSPRLGGLFRPQNPHEVEETPTGPPRSLWGPITTQSAFSPNIGPGDTSGSLLTTHSSPHQIPFGGTQHSPRHHQDGHLASPIAAELPLFAPWLHAPPRAQKHTQNPRSEVDSNSNISTGHAKFAPRAWASSDPEESLSALSQNHRANPFGSSNLMHSSIVANSMPSAWNLAELTDQPARAVHGPGSSFHSPPGVCQSGMAQLQIRTHDFRSRGGWSAEPSGETAAAAAEYGSSSCSFHASDATNDHNDRTPAQTPGDVVDSPRLHHNARMQTEPDPSLSAGCHNVTSVNTTDTDTDIDSGNSSKIHESTLTNPPEDSSHPTPRPVTVREKKARLAAMNDKLARVAAGASATENLLYMEGRREGAQGRMKNCEAF